LGLVQELEELDVRVAESDANFIWVRVAEGEDALERERAVVAGLAERGVLVRAGSSLGGPGALRVTVGTPEENGRFAQALRDLL
jgi:histidinol-phosphate aminotransferase